MSDDGMSPRNIGKHDKLIIENGPDFPLPFISNPSPHPINGADHNVVHIIKVHVSLEC